jgi:hypothetical protein
VQFIEHLPVLEIAHDTMFGAVSAARMDFIALFKRARDRISLMYPKE